MYYTTLLPFPASLIIIIIFFHNIDSSQAYFPVAFALVKNYMKKSLESITNAETFHEIRNTVLGGWIKGV